MHILKTSPNVNICSVPNYIEYSQSVQYMHLNTYFFNFVLYLLAYTLQLNMGRDMWFPTLWLFGKCRLSRACAALFKPRNSKWCLASSIGVIEYSSY